jgi:1-acyl-sn-glycerol-3-phosphate acyltransferase
MISIFKQLHRYWFLFCIIFFFSLFFPFYYILSKNERYYIALNFLRKINSLISCFFAGIIFKINYQNKLDSKQTYIYCANHTSLVDIMILCVIGNGKFHFMGKEELLDNLLFRVFFKTIDITVNRSSKISAFRSFKKAGENLEKGMSLIIFPEGKIDDLYPPVLHEFKNGPFRLAIEKNIPLVPVSIINVWNCFFDDGSKYGSKPGICDIYIHKPINTTDLQIDDADVLKENVYQLINSKLI